jgi:hypothetical protein
MIKDTVKLRRAMRKIKLNKPAPRPIAAVPPTPITPAHS